MLQARVVRKLAVVVDGFEGLAEVVGERVGGEDGLPSGLDKDGAGAMACLDEFFLIDHPGRVSIQWLTARGRTRL